ncbi:hypothetical protein POM88_019753 [Heracleum sosnowskyi]|uniref:Uncharacterized protein n=1 Tax=Heracleum sosnowskyi TaxID=360622 RepID=A0AAD8IB88_9APIA|nr:hypothetical protein POM88_019748 [Heracleum sosnowskyi]KAK1382018.1 hypothetical protein POM88_019753 [Heracleum sosnowskyi]
MNCTALCLDGPGGRTTVLHDFINISQGTEETRDTITMIFDAVKRRSSEEDPPHVSFETLFNRTDESGRTVLELAMEKNYVKIVEVVLQEDLAYRRGTGISGDHKDVVKLILAIKSSDKGCVSNLLLDAKQLDATQ